MPSCSEQGSSKRKKCASSGEVEVEDSSKNLSTKNDGKNKDPKERCKSMSPRRNSWREDIKKIKGWREELKDRLKRRDYRQSKVLCDRVTKRSSRLSRMRTLRCERVPSKQSSKVMLIKNGSGKRDTKKKQCEKSGSSYRPLHSEGEVLREEGKFKIINDVERSMGMDEHGDLKGKKGGLEENKYQLGTNEDTAEQDSSLSSQRSKHCLEILLSNSGKKIVSVDEKVSRSPPLDESEDKKSTSQFVKRLAEHDQIPGPPQYNHRLILNQEKNTFETSTSSNEEDDTGAMARNISLLELKMEVFTTRLKELEWEREQLRKERESFQAGFPELSSKKRMRNPKEREELFSKNEGGLKK